MFHKTRKKIVISIVTVLVLFFAVTFLAIIGSNYYSLKQQNSEMLERYVSVYSLENLPGNEPPDHSPDSAADLSAAPGGAVYQLSSFYSVAKGNDGTILAVDTGTNGLYQETEIIETAEQILITKKSSGIFRSMMYRVEQRDNYTLIAFMDMAVMDNSMHMLLFNTFVVGIIAICFFFFVSVIVARKIVRPLEENDRRQKQFVSDAGHELKTPVSVAAANAEILERQIGENQWLSNIRYENERMGNLVKELLMLARADNNTALPEEIDLSKLTEQEVLPFEGTAFERGLVIKSNIADKIMVKGNRHQLEQLVSILTDNAICHSTGGEINVELKKEHHNAVLRVSNEGAAIPEDIRARLFDRFYRIDEARGNDGEHFGLGLSIAKAITIAHSGQINVYCHEGKVIFSVLLPADK